MLAFVLSLPGSWKHIALATLVYTPWSRMYATSNDGFAAYTNARLSTLGLILMKPLPKAEHLFIILVNKIRETPSAVLMDRSSHSPSVLFVAVSTIFCTSAAPRMLESRQLACADAHLHTFFADAVNMPRVCDDGRTHVDKSWSFPITRHHSIGAETSDARAAPCTSTIIGKHFDFNDNSEECWCTKYVPLIICMFHISNKDYTCAAG